MVVKTKQSPTILDIIKKRQSSARKSASPKRKSMKRTSPKRKSMKRTSPKRKSMKSVSPKRVKNSKLTVILMKKNM
jgi:hypothetical protein